MSKPYQVMIVAGESSGEAHAAKLVSQLKNTNQSFEFFGMGGQLMQDEGVELIENIEHTAVMGIVELFGKLGFLYKTLFKLTAVLKANKPDILILVDFQAFNLKLATRAKKLGIKTLFYIGPQVWAWRAYRVKKMAKVIDHIAVIFPFEVDFYQQHQLAVTYVGHPLSAGIKVNKSRTELLAQYHLNPTKKIIAFLPGSRQSEIDQHLPIFNQVMQNLAQNPNFECLISLCGNRENPLFAQLPDNAQIVDDFYSLVNAADFVVVASGTATLECAILATPMLVTAKVSRLSYWIYKKMLRVKYISMVNILVNNRCVNELVQRQVTAENIRLNIEQFFSNPNIGKNMQHCFSKIKTILRHEGTDDLAKIVVKMIAKD